MKQPLKIAAIVVTVTLIATACGGSADSVEVANSATAEPSEASTKSPNNAGSNNAASDDAWPFTFVGNQIDGGIFDAGDYAGQDLVLWFWAPW